MKLTVKPDLHQIDAAKFMASRNAALLAYATGTGKSLCQILTSFLLIQKERIDKFLIVATPNSLIEIKNDFEQFSDYVPKILSTVEELKVFLLTDESKIGIIKYGLIDRTSATELYPILRSVRTAVSFDEFHKLKNREALVTQAFVQIRGAFTYCYGSTATAVTSKLEDLYWLIDFLSPGLLGTYTDFSDRYMERQLQTIYLPGGATRKVWKILRYKNLDDLRERLSFVMTTFYPPYDIRYTTVRTPMRNPLPYLEAAEGVLEVCRKGRRINPFKESDNDIELDGPKSYSARMQDAQYAVNNDSAKKELFCKVLLEQIEHGVLVYCTHHDTVEVISMMLKELGIPYGKITGKSTSASRKKNKEWFVSDPLGKALIITMGGGQSLNLQATNRLIFYDLPFGIGNYIQVLGRVARYFSLHKSFEVTYVVMQDTIDEYKVSYIEQNAEPISAILRNKMGSKIKMPEYNDFILTKLRKELIWSKQRKVKDVG